MITYTAPRDASRLIRERFNDQRLQAEVAQFIGEVPEPIRQRPCAWMARYIVTPTFEMMRFLDIATEVGIPPIISEYPVDKFFQGNPEKTALLKLRFTGAIGRKQTPIVRYKTVRPFNECSGRSMGDISTTHGERLTDFHHRLLRQAGLFNKIGHYDISPWYANHGGKAELYYTHLLALFVCFGVLFETFYTAGDGGSFTEKIVAPAWKKVRATFGLDPLVVAHVPPEQVDDPHWDSYPLSLLDEVDRAAQ